MMITINEQWREELLALLRGDHVTNQGLPLASQPPVLTWKGLRFRSGAEVRIAEALERAQVLFLPNCLARLGFSHRENRGADFLICQRGKWGILEVDGPLAHPPSRKVDDDEQARLFKAHGPNMARTSWLLVSFGEPGLDRSRAGHDWSGAGGAPAASTGP